MTAVFRAIANTVAPLNRFDVHGQAADADAQAAGADAMEPQP